MGQGYEILAQNWTMHGGELDVVARRGSVLAVCEVKARANDAFGSPAEALTALKQMRVRRAGRAFVATLSSPLPSQVRYDLACVLGSVLEMHLDAF